MSDFIVSYPIRKIIEHSPIVKSYYFEKVFDVRAGQFINLWIPDIDEKPFSISDATDDLIEISVKAFGPFSQALMKCRTGDMLGIRGPFGNGFSFKNNALLIGGGIGIAPLRILAHQLHRNGYRFACLLGALNASELIFADEFEKTAQCYFTTDDGSKGAKGLVTDNLRDIIEKEKIEYIYAAGPEIMFVKIKELLDVLKLPYEFCMERYMKCGIGICGQCVLDGSGIRLCVEGPVVNHIELEEVTELGMPHRDAAGRRMI